MRWLDNVPDSMCGIVTSVSETGEHRLDVVPLVNPLLLACRHQEGAHEGEAANARKLGCNRVSAFVASNAKEPSRSIGNRLLDRRPVRDDIAECLGVFRLDRREDVRIAAQRATRSVSHGEGT